MSGEAVKVIVRCRPMNQREEKLNCEVVLKMDPTIAQVQLLKPNNKEAPPKLFTFDGVFYMKDTTHQIYEDICFPLVEGVLQGYNGTVFAYGQTGCGKSFTMTGVEEPVANKGVIPRAFEHIFDQVAVTNDIKFLIRASYLEIYNEEVRDLLGKDTKKKLDLHEHPEKGVYVQGLSAHKVHNVQDLERIMELGSKNRSVGATLMNVDSSRSHSIFSIDVEMIDSGDDGKERLRAGRLNLVDLAGSERQSKTGSTGDRLKEATKINLSLSALGNVISALVDGKSKHIPYRDSKLTRLLQSSLGGNTKTLMVACVSPADNNFDETLSTLRYANRAKNIKNKPRINEDPKDALLREYKEEIQKLKMMLLGQMDVPPGITSGDFSTLGGLQVSPSHVQPVVTSSGPSEDQLRAWEEEKEALRREYEARIAELKEKFGKEQADKAQLQSELDKLQKEWNDQLSKAQERMTTLVPPQAPPTTIATESNGLAITTTHPSADGLPNPPHLGGDGLTPVTSDDPDRRALKQHELALQKLEDLQKDMIGGEKEGNSELRRKLEERRRAAEERQVRLVEATSLFDDDGIMEKIFNSLTDEVRVKTTHLERTQAKLRSAEEDITDIQAEFEVDRQDYLDTIRKQERTIKLQEQLLQTVVPLLRQSCNYYNIDKIRTECVWDEERDQWILPKLVTTKTNLSQVSSKTSLLDKRHDGHTAASRSPIRSVSPDVPLQMKGFSPSHGVNASESEEDRYLLRLQKSNDSDYFKPKRALELLKETNDHSQSGGSGGSGSGLSPNLHSMDRKVMSTGCLVPNAAAVHKVNALIVGDATYGRRPGKLESLPGNPPPFPQALSTRHPEPNNILEKVEKKLSNRKRINSLQPLSDIKPRKPPPGY